MTKEQQELYKSDTFIRSNTAGREMFNYNEKLEREIEEQLGQMSSNIGLLFSKYPHQQSSILEILYQKTKERKIDLLTDEGKEVWRNIFEIYREDENRKAVIYSRLIVSARYNIHKFACDALFVAWGGVNGSIDAGNSASAFVDKFFTRARGIRLEDITEGKSK